MKKIFNLGLMLYHASGFNSMLRPPLRYNTQLHSNNQPDSQFEDNSFEPSKYAEFQPKFLKQDMNFNPISANQICYRVFLKKVAEDNSLWITLSSCKSQRPLIEKILKDSNLPKNPTPELLELFHLIFLYCSDKNRQVYFNQFKTFCKLETSISEQLHDMILDSNNKHRLKTQYSKEVIRNAIHDHYKTKLNKLFEDLYVEESKEINHKHPKYSTILKIILSFDPMFRKWLSFQTLINNAPISLKQITIINDIISLSDMNQKAHSIHNHLSQNEINILMKTLFDLMFSCFKDQDIENEQFLLTVLDQRFSVCDLLSMNLIVVHTSYVYLSLDSPFKITDAQQFLEKEFYWAMSAHILRSSDFNVIFYLTQQIPSEKFDPFHLLLKLCVDLSSSKMINNSISALIYSKFR